MNWDQAFKKYNHNLFRQLTFINRYLHQSMNDQLQAGGYAGVKMSFIQVIPYLGREGTRMTELMEMHRLPKASMSRLINTVHHQGYLEKRSDPADSRANILFISERGKQLVKDAYHITITVEKELCQLMGKAHFTAFTRTVEQCFDALQLNFPPVRLPTPHHWVSATKAVRGQLQIQINAIVKHVDVKLLESNQAAGFDDLQPSHQAVLAHITEEGIRASDIAKREALTKQSISDISYTLLENNYLKRINDPLDKRAHRLIFSERGKKMIINAMSCLQKKEQTLTQTMGHDAFGILTEQSQRLWCLLGGQSLAPLSGDDFSALENTVQVWLTQLLQEVQNNHSHDFSKVFIKTDKGYGLSPNFLPWLQNRTC